MHAFFSSFMYSIALLSLMYIDYIMGNGVVDICQKIMCKLLSIMRNFLKEEQRLAQIKDDMKISITVLISEIVFLGLTVMFLNKYKKIRCKDKIDELLQESREALLQTNEFLEKWRLRRMNMISSEENTYLDEEPQEIIPCKIEVPILHMAIIDTLGTRNQPGSGDTGDITYHLDSALISLTSLLDDDFDSTTEEVSDKIEETKSNTNRILWDVTEEEGSIFGEY